MWNLNRRKSGQEEGDQPPAPPQRLRDTIRQVRIETAERTSVVVDLRDAEVARLELLNEALEPIFAEMPPDVELFDRGISKGQVPRLWIDVLAYVVMGRDKRTYRFVQDTRYGRKVLLESLHVGSIVEAVTRYVAGRLVERERALADDIDFPSRDLRRGRPRRGWSAVGNFLFGLVVGAITFFIVLWLLAKH